MKKKLFLHIGFNKTGSTTIQRTLAENSEALLKRGVFYPNNIDASYQQRWQHVPLAAAVPDCNLHWLLPKKRKTLHRAFEELKEAIVAHAFDTLVLSSEGFGETNMGVEKLTWLKEQFVNFDIFIVAYIRRQDEYFLSTYQEAIKAGRSRRFNFSDFSSLHQLHFGRRLSAWREVFGHDHVLVRPFSRQHWLGGDLVQDFLATANIDFEPIAKVKTENESLDFRAVELLRRLNVFRDENPSEAISLPEARKVAMRYNSSCAQSTGKRKMLLSSEQSNKLRAHFLKDNQTALKDTNVSVEDFFPAIQKDTAARLTPKQLDEKLLLSLIAQRKS